MKELKEKIYKDLNENYEEFNAYDEFKANQKDDIKDIEELKTYLNSPEAYSYLELCWITEEYRDDKELNKEEIEDLKKYYIEELKEAIVYFAEMTEDFDVEG